MHPSLQDCLSMILEAAGGLDDDQGAVRVGERWSVAEIVEHLDRTYTGTTKGFERCLAAGAVKAGALTMRIRARKFTILTLGLFPSGIEAPRHVTPTGQPRLSALLERVSGSLAKFDDAARRAEARWGRALVLDHPILGPFTADDWRRFHRVHTRHHQRQIVERRRLAAAIPR